MQYEKWDYFKVSATELAQALGVTRGTIWRWQTGLSKPTRRHQERVEQVLQELAPLVLPELRSEKPDQKSGRPDYSSERPYTTATLAKFQGPGADAFRK